MTGDEVTVTCVGVILIGVKAVLAGEVAVTGGEVGLTDGEVGFIGGEVVMMEAVMGATVVKAVPLKKSVD